MSRAVIHSNERRAAFEPLYEMCPHTGAVLELFYADQVLAHSFGTRAGWHWWTCHPGKLPVRPPVGPFSTSYAAYRDAMGGAHRLFGK